MRDNQIVLSGQLDRIVITATDGRVFDLGRPSSPFFRMRLSLYKLRRRLRG